MVLRRAWLPVVGTMAGGVVAVGSGMAAMALGGAPALYLATNAAAVCIGLVVAAGLSAVPMHVRWPALAAAAALLATAQWGAELEDMHRWVLFGSVRLQPAFLLLPLILCSYARSPDAPVLVASVAISAGALALQRDPSMAAALAVVAAAVFVAVRNRTTGLVLVAGLAAVVYASLTEHRLEPVRFVEAVIVDAYRNGPVFGGIILAGTLALIAPMLLAGRVEKSQRRATVAFVLVWIVLLVASILGPYPTPLLGYGASAIIGYFAALAVLRPVGRGQSSLP